MFKIDTIKIEHEDDSEEEIDCDCEEEIIIPINIKYTPSIIGVGFGM